MQRMALHEMMSLGAARLDDLGIDAFVLREAAAQSPRPQTGVGRLARGVSDSHWMSAVRRATFG